MTFLLFSLLIGCKKENEICLFINENVPNSSDFEFIIIISENDCHTCYVDLLLDDLYKKDNTIGFYISKHPKLFVEKLNKFNSNIQWKPISQSLKIITPFKGQIGECNELK